MAGTIVIGEGERDEAPMLYIGEQVGRRDPEGRRAAAEIDIAVDPLEGTNLVAHGQSNAITVLAASETGGLLHAPDTYLEKLCVGPVAAGRVDIRLSPTENLRRIASALGRAVSDITVVILERPRHDALIAEVREAGARIKLISDGDLSAAISCAVSGTGVHAVMGIGGAPEGVITAAALRCLGGEIQARFRFRNDEERRRARDRWATATRSGSITTEDLASGEQPRLRGDRRHGRRPAPGRPLLRRRRPDPFAGDGLPDQAGPIRRHRPHVRPEPAAGRPAVAEAIRETGHVRGRRGRGGRGWGEDGRADLGGSHDDQVVCARAGTRYGRFWPAGAGRSRAVLQGRRGRSGADDALIGSLTPDMTAWPSRRRARAGGYRHEPVAASQRRSAGRRPGPRA